MNKYIEVYEKMCPNDSVARGDDRRDAIIQEMRAVESALNSKEAAKAIDWWGWDSPSELTRWVNRARKLMAAK